MTSDTFLDEAAFRRALGRFATGIAVVTTRREDGRVYAMTINAFSSVSLDPPLILFCLGRSAFHFDAFAEAEAFAINILRAEQRALSDRCAREAEDDLADLTLRSLVTGSPVLPGCLVTLDCCTEAHHDAGDHVIVVGRVSAIEEDGTGAPLIYFGSRYRRLKPSDDE